MIYVALLRGINVGGKAKVEMSRLKGVFEQLGYNNVVTYINSGNVIFESLSGSRQKIAKDIDDALESKFGFNIKVILRTHKELGNLVMQIPDTWVNNDVMKCDVMFLMEEIDNPAILKRIPHNPQAEDVIYLPGAVVWRIDRSKIRQGQVLKITGSDIHKRLTVRNPNTVRKILATMQDAAGD
ncbi:MAG TPA: DUF1697 domain-containing protein [Candidatus Dormibacteraeota bacterium]|nr:DUF1697 domain-containing protein [Candidatus Dormibacteraeota bacterium]